MARNKITFETEYRNGRMLYHFTGNKRQPTIVEAYDFLVENRLFNEINDSFGVACIDLYEKDWLPPEEACTLTFEGYDGGTGGSGSCPICGHERDLSGDYCPICKRKWQE